MSDIMCAVCGEPWEEYYVYHEMTEYERRTFTSGCGCPSCVEMVGKIAEVMANLNSYVKKYPDMKDVVKDIKEGLKKNTLVKGYREEFIRTMIEASEEDPMDILARLDRE